MVDYEGVIFISGVKSSASDTVLEVIVVEIELEILIPKWVLFRCIL
jgi:hypothetical protein